MNVMCRLSSIPSMEELGGQKTERAHSVILEFLGQKTFWRKFENGV